MNTEPTIDVETLKGVIGAHLYQAVPSGALEMLDWNLFTEVEKMMLWMERDEVEAWCITHLRGFQRLAWRWIWSWEEPTANEMLEEEMFRLSGLVRGYYFRMREIDAKLAQLEAQAHQE